MKKFSSDVKGATAPVLESSLDAIVPPVIIIAIFGFLLSAFISIFFVMGILMFVIVDGVIANSKLTALTNFEISLEADDRGTEILALLQTNIEGSYLDKISAVSAENYKEHIDLSNLNSTVKKLSRFEGNYSFDKEKIFI